LADISGDDPIILPIGAEARLDIYLYKILTIKIHIEVCTLGIIRYFTRHIGAAIEYGNAEYNYLFCEIYEREK